MDTVRLYIIYAYIYNDIYSRDIYIYIMCPLRLIWHGKCRCCTIPIQKIRSHSTMWTMIAHDAYVLYATSTCESTCLSGHSGHTFFTTRLKATYSLYVAEQRSLYSFVSGSLLQRFYINHFSFDDVIVTAAVGASAATDILLLRIGETLDPVVGHHV